MISFCLDLFCVHIDRSTLPPGTSVILSAAPSWTSASPPILLTLGGVNGGQSGSNMSNNQCVQPTLPSYIVVPPMGISNPQTNVSGQGTLSKSCTLCCLYYVEKLHRKSTTIT